MSAIPFPLSSHLGLQFAQNLWNRESVENRLSPESYFRQIEDAIFPPVILEFDKEAVSYIMSILQNPPMMNKKLENAFLRYEKEVG